MITDKKSFQWDIKFEGYGHLGNDVKNFVWASGLLFYQSDNTY